VDIHQVAIGPIQTWTMGSAAVWTTANHGAFASTALATASSSVIKVVGEQYATTNPNCNGPAKHNTAKNPVEMSTGTAQEGNACINGPG
jgi:hypothetical protein